MTIDLDELQGEQLALMELLTPGCYVCDILGAEISVGSFRELMAVYKHLRSLTLGKHGCQVVRTKNGFSRLLPKPGCKERGFRLISWKMLILYNK